MSEHWVHGDLVHSIIGAFYDVYNYYKGYGLTEAIYTGALEYELVDRGHQVVRELAVPVGISAPSQDSIASSTSQSEPLALPQFPHQKIRQIRPIRQIRLRTSWALPGARRLRNPTNRDESTPSPRSHLLVDVSPYHAG
jgi:PD-(D/E)XK nuclease superfamily